MDELEALKKDYVTSLPTKISDITKCAEDVLKQLRKRGQTPEWEDLENRLHKLTGSSGTYGFSGLSEMARYMEDAIAEQVVTKLDPKDAADHVRMWISIFEEVSEAATKGQNDSVDQELSRLQDHVLFFLTKKTAA